MKGNTIQKYYLFFFFTCCASMTIAQEIQDKTFIINGNFYFPQTESRIASFCFGSIDFSYADNIDCRELAIGLLSASNDKVKYTIRDGKVIAPSFFQSRGKYQGETTITASKPSEMRSFDDEDVISQIEFFKGTLHDSFNVTLINGTPIKETIFRNRFKELAFDFVVTDEGDLLCLLVIGWSTGTRNQILKIWKLLDGKEKIIKWGEWDKEEDWTELINKSELLMSLSLPERMEMLTTFSLMDKLFVFNPVSGQFYQLVDSDFELVTTGLKSRKSHIDSTLVIDKDNGKVFLLPKSILKQEHESFRDILEQYGKEILIPK